MCENEACCAIIYLNELAFRDKAESINQSYRLIFNVILSKREVSARFTDSIGLLFRGRFLLEDYVEG